MSDLWNPSNIPAQAPHFDSGVVFKKLLKLFCSIRSLTDAFSVFQVSVNERPSMTSEPFRSAADDRTGINLDAPILLITCRKLKPKVDQKHWCRSCDLNLKKRCGGLQLPPGAPPRPEQYGPSPAAAASKKKKKKKGNAESSGKLGTDEKRFSADGKRSRPTPNAENRHGPPTARGGHARSAAFEALLKIKAPLQRLPPAQRSVLLSKHDQTETGDGAESTDGSDTDSDEGSDDNSAEENWAQCEDCDKWRKLPLHVNPDDLPKKW